MARRFLQILILSLSIQTTNCWLQNPTLPKHFKIHSKFTESEREMILKAATKWNELAQELTDYNEILIYDGIDERPFNKWTSLDDGINTIYTIPDDFEFTTTSKFNLGNVPLGGENIFLNRSNMYTQSATYDQIFLATITHEFGHFLGIGIAHINENPNNTIEKNETVRGIMASQFSRITVEFSKEDKELFCLVHKCKK